MADILHDFPIKATAERVFQAVSTSQGLDTWWTKRSSGEPTEGAVFDLWFGPEHDWRGIVRRCIPNTDFELEIRCADEDWNGTRVGFYLQEKHGSTTVRFHHKGWPMANEHFRRSSYCWAMYLRVLRRSLEMGDSVPYESRFDA